MMKGFQGRWTTDILASGLWRRQAPRAVTLGELVLVLQGLVLV